MGLFSEMKESIESAQKMSGDDPVFVAAQRIDTLVADRSGEKRLRTDYAGTIWFGGELQMVGNKPLPGADAQINSVLRLPDSHVYEPGAADAQTQTSVAVQGAMATTAGGYFQITASEASLAEDSAGGALAVHLAVRAMVTLPVGLAYRVTVVCDPAELREVEGHA